VEGELTSQARATATVRAAVEAGITEYDTAPLYGFGSSEERLGAALAALPAAARASIHVTTKVGRLVRAADGASEVEPGFEDAGRGGKVPLEKRTIVNDYTSAGAARSHGESLQRLGVAGAPAQRAVECLRIHDANDNSSNADTEANDEVRSGSLL